MRAQATAQVVVPGRLGKAARTAFGRSNSGTIRGDVQVADHDLSLFFRI